MTETGEKNSFPYGILAIVSVMIGVYYAVGVWFGSEGTLGPYQPDTLIYAQYARNMANGNFFRFNPADLPTTGCTGHTFVLLLSLLSYLGARDDLLFAGLFCLNTVFFVVFLVIIRSIFQKLSPRWGVCPQKAMDGVGLWGLSSKDGARARNRPDGEAFSGLSPGEPENSDLGFGLVALNGFLLFTAMGQTDMPLFLTLSATCFWAALSERKCLFFLLLMILPVTRPEGFVLSGFWCLLAAGFWLFHKRDQSREMIPAALFGLLGIGLAIISNYAVTGSMSYDSLSGKGLYQLPFFSFLFHSTSAAVSLFGEFLFGLTSGPSGRLFLWPPVLGGGLFFLGLLDRLGQAQPFRRTEAWFAGSALVSLLLVAVSGRQGTLNDRYLVWIVPMIIFYQFAGIQALKRRSKSARDGTVFSNGHGLETLLIAGFLSWQILSHAFFLSLFAEGCRVMTVEKKFCRMVQEKVSLETTTGPMVLKLKNEPKNHVPASASMGFYDEPYLAYFLPGFSPVCLAGLFTPELPTGEATNLEVLKHHPEKRFPLMLQNSTPGESWLKAVLGSVSLADPSIRAWNRPSLALWHTRWDLLDHACQPQSPDIASRCQGYALVDQLDVGYLPDERRSGYHHEFRQDGLEPTPFFVSGSIPRGEGGQAVDIAEIGRFVSLEKFSIRVVPQRDVLMVYRFARRAVVKIRGLNVLSANQIIETGGASGVRMKASSADGAFLKGVPATDGQYLQSSRDETFLEGVFGENFFLADVGKASDDLFEGAVLIPAVPIVGPAMEITLSGDHLSTAFWFYQKKE